MNIDHMTRRQFVRDFKLPIQVVQDDYFEYFLNLYQEHYKAKDKYQLLIDTVNKLGSLEAFVAELKRVREMAIDSIKENEGYKKLQEDRLNEFNSNFSQKINLYNHDNNGKTFVSIDMVKGNVQSLNFYDKRILSNADSYETFISRFTDFEYFKQSKQIRQVIFGNISPKKQQKIQKYIMGLVKEELLLNEIKESDIYSSSSDELVIAGEFFDICKTVLASEKLKEFNFHLELFKLKELKEDLPVFIKEFKNKEGIEIKQGNAKYMAEIIKFIKKEPLHPYDLVFFDEGRIATYAEPLILTR